MRPLPVRDLQVATALLEAPTLSHFEASALCRPNLAVSGTPLPAQRVACQGEGASLASIVVQAGSRVGTLLAGQTARVEQPAWGCLCPSPEALGPHELRAVPSVCPRGLCVRLAAPVGSVQLRASRAPGCPRPRLPTQGGVPGGRGLHVGGAPAVSPESGHCARG